MPPMSPIATAHMQISNKDRIQHLEHKRNNEEANFGLLPPDDVLLSSEAVLGENKKMSRSASLPNIFERSIENTLDLNASQKEKLQKDTSSMPKMYNHLHCKLGNVYSDELVEKLKNSQKKQEEKNKIDPGYSLTDALLDNNRLTEMETNKYFKGTLFVGEKYTDDTLNRAVSSGHLDILKVMRRTGNPNIDRAKEITGDNSDIVRAMQEVKGHGYTEMDLAGLSDHCMTSWKEIRSGSIEQYKKSPKLIIERLANENIIHELPIEEIHALAVAAKPEHIQNAPDFLSRLLIYSRETNWNLVKLIHDKGNNFIDSPYHLETLSSMIRAAGGDTLKVLQPASKIGLIPNVHDFMCKVAHDYKSYKDVYTLSDEFIGVTDRPREIIFTGLLKHDANTQKSLLLRPNSAGESPVSILKNQYNTHLTDDLQKFVDHFSVSNNASLRSNL